jgi:hypothetical protein
MSPFIKDGDVITIAPLLGNSVSVGDVVAFLHPGTDKLTIHRVVGKRENTYRVRGDHTFGEDGLIPVGNILGRVKEVKRNEKNVWIGLGPERFLIAWLNRRGILFPLMHPIWKMIGPLIPF